jgi:hypothetical protein
MFAAARCRGIGVVECRLPEPLEIAYFLPGLTKPSGSDDKLQR